VSLIRAAVKVAGFPPHANLARLQTVRTTFMDLSQFAYLKRTYFGPVEKLLPPDSTYSKAVWFYPLRLLQIES
jgi:hypothetical protein